jgi:hypothetical protein
LSALLGAGLSTEHFRAAAEQKEVAQDDADANIAAKYYVNQILNLDEGSIQQAWLKVGAACQHGPAVGRACPVCTMLQRCQHELQRATCFNFEVM